MATYEFLKNSPHEIIVRLSVGDISEEIYFRNEDGYLSFSPEAMAAALTLPAQKFQEPLVLPDPVSPEFLKNLEAIQKIYTLWDDYEAVPVQTRPRISHNLNENRGIGCFFTAGADSFYTYFQNQERVTHLVYVHGFDGSYEDRDALASLSARMRAAAKDLDKPLIEVETNLKKFMRACAIPWGSRYNGPALGAVAQLLTGVLKEIYISASYSFLYMPPYGSHLFVDPLWSSDALTIHHHGCESLRTRKVIDLSNKPVAMRHLRVCFQDAYGTNCGRCEKCLRTLMIFRVLKKPELGMNFEQPLDLNRAKHFAVKSNPSGYYDLLKLCKKNGGDPELERTIHAMIDQKYGGLFWRAYRKFTGFYR